MSRNLKLYLKLYVMYEDSINPDEQNDLYSKNGRIIL